MPCVNLETSVAEWKEHWVFRSKIAESLFVSWETLDKLHDVSEPVFSSIKMFIHSFSKHLPKAKYDPDVEDSSDGNRVYLEGKKDD